MSTSICAGSGQPWETSDENPRTRSVSPVCPACRKTPAELRVPRPSRQPVHGRWRGTLPRHLSEEAGVTLTVTAHLDDIEEEKQLIISTDQLPVATTVATSVSLLPFVVYVTITEGEGGYLVAAYARGMTYSNRVRAVTTTGGQACSACRTGRGTHTCGVAALQDMLPIGGK